MSCLRLTLKLLQLIACISALIFKKLTDKHAMRVFTINQKFSREWGLLNNLTWSAEGHDYSILTYGGYTFITAVLFIANLIERDAQRHVSEQIFIICGMIFFSIQGFLVFTSLEYIPKELEINAYVLGSLTFLIAFLLLIDFFYTPRNYYGLDKKYEITKKLAFNNNDLTDQYKIKRPKLKPATSKEEPVVERAVDPAIFSVQTHQNQDENDSFNTLSSVKSGKYKCEDIDKRKRWINGKVHTLTGPKDRPLTADPFQYGYYYKNNYFNTEV